MFNTRKNLLHCNKFFKNIKQKRPSSDSRPSQISRPSSFSSSKSISSGMASGGNIESNKNSASSTLQMLKITNDQKVNTTVTLNGETSLLNFNISTLGEVTSHEISTVVSNLQSSFNSESIYVGNLLILPSLKTFTFNSLSPNGNLIVIADDISINNNLIIGMGADIYSFLTAITPSFYINDILSIISSFYIQIYGLYSNVLGNDFVIYGSGDVPSSSSNGLYWSSSGLNTNTLTIRGNLEHYDGNFKMFVNRSETSNTFISINNTLNITPIGFNINWLILDYLIPIVISSSTFGFTTSISTFTNHGKSIGDEILIIGSDNNIDGIHSIISISSSSSFTIPCQSTSPATQGFIYDKYYNSFFGINDNKHFIFDFNNQSHIMEFHSSFTHSLIYDQSSLYNSSDNNLVLLYHSTKECNLLNISLSDSLHLNSLHINDALSINHFGFITIEHFIINNLHIFDSGNINFNNHVEIFNPSVNGSLSINTFNLSENWRVFQSGSELIFQYKNGDIWTNKVSIT